jgi:hypothetical protein
VLLRDDNGDGDGGTGSRYRPAGTSGTRLAERAFTSTS